jgi:RNA-dependent RNA polymerase
LVKSKPDWYRPEGTATHQGDYYESDRALGHLYRNIDMHVPDDLLPVPSLKEVVPLDDPISRALAPLVQIALDAELDTSCVENAQTEDLHTRFASEMRYICVMHGPAPNVHLTEEEAVLGTVRAKSTQPHWRADRAYRMTMHTQTLLHDLRAQIASVSLAGEEGLRDGLRDAWAIWGWAQHHREKPFIESFALVALALIFDHLQQLGVLPDAGVSSL